jgi:hypothetical protein
MKITEDTLTDPGYTDPALLYLLMDINETQPTQVMEMIARQVFSAETIAVNALKRVELLNRLMPDKKKQKGSRRIIRWSLSIFSFVWVLFS